jgi:hypothetical protein
LSQKQKGKSGIQVFSSKNYPKFRGKGKGEKGKGKREKGKREKGERWEMWIVNPQKSN